MKNLSKEELIQKLGDIEWEDFEVKEAKSDVPKSSLETVSAFSNTSGGWLVFGVKKEGKYYDIEGVESPEKTEQDFISVLRNGLKFNKKLEVKCQKYNFGEKTVLAFYIHASENKPVFYDNVKNSFIRSGSGDQRLTEQEIVSLYRNSSFGTRDKELTDLTINDLSMESIKRYRTYPKNIKPEHHYNSFSDEKFLTKIQALEDKKVTFAGLLVFGTEDAIGKYFSDFRIDYLEIFGTSYEDAEKRYEFRLSDYPNIYEYFFAIYERIIKKTDIPFELKGAFRDENQPQVKAIREALVNLLIHSDYFSPMKPRIRVFLNRVEFLNPGTLPKQYKELQKGDIFLPSNPIIASIFRVIDLAENTGYGFDNMFKGWRYLYTKDPVVFEGIDYYRIEFFFEVKVTENVPENRLERIKNIIYRDNKISIPKLAKEMKVNEKIIKRDIEKLRKLNKIRRIGPDKGGFWEILKNENQELK